MSKSKVDGFPKSPDDDHLYLDMDEQRRASFARKMKPVEGGMVITVAQWLAALRKRDDPAD